MGSLLCYMLNLDQIAISCVCNLLRPGRRQGKWNPNTKKKYAYISDEDLFHDFYELREITDTKMKL